MRLRFAKRAAQVGARKFVAARTTNYDSFLETGKSSFVRSIGFVVYSEPINRHSTIPTQLHQIMFQI
jgi:hypothetical protein